MHQLLLPFRDRQASLTLLGSYVMHAAALPISISEIENKAKKIRLRFYDGELQEVVWRLTAAQMLRVLPDGRICRRLGVNLERYVREYPGAP